MSEWGYRRDDQDSYETAAAETYGDSGYGDDVDGGRRQQSSYDGDEAGGYEKPSYGDSDDSGYGGGKTNSYGAEDGVGGDFGYSPDADRTTDESDAQERLDAIEQSRDEETTYERTEDGGLLAAAAAGGYALYERHEMEEDPENAARHKLEMEVAAGVAVTGAGVGLYGHHEKEEAEEDREELEEGPEKKHGWFGGDEEETTNEYSEDQPEKKSSWF
ncbi:unnamed protein product [Sphagnum balticum]